MSNEPDFVVRRERCETCAFTPGTRANQNAITVTKAKLCVLSGEPFYCHDNLMATGGTTLEPAPGSRMMLCHGFVDAMQNRLDRGKDEPDWKRVLYVAMNDAIAEVEMNPLLHDKPEAQAALLYERVSFVLARLEREAGTDAH